ncbi:MAG: tetratricopeptide repeat protein [Pirellulales bacterium]
MATETPGRQPLPPAIRRRLQQCFEHGCKSAATANFDYAADMFDTCVKGDPANGIYIKQYLASLGKRYNDNKKGAGFTSAPKFKVLQGVVKKSQYSKDWSAVLEKGWDVLKLHPWDIMTLSAMADAAGELHFDEAQLTYLKQALDVNPKDAEVNRKCGRALAALGHFDQAIACWHRVEQARPGDEEAGRAVADLAIEKTISSGKYEEAEGSQAGRADKDKLEELTDKESRFTPVQRLERAIAKKPEDIGLYFELADLHTREERYQQAEEVLRKGLEASGGDVMVRERLEDSQLRTARAQLSVAKSKAGKERTPEAVTLYRKMKKELNSAELDVYRNRSERYPNNLRHKFELATRLKKAEQFQEAIGSFQGATGDPKTKAKVHLGLGECFQAIKQYKLAMQNYEASLEALSAREVDDRKWALYLAGRLALALAEKDLAAKQPHASDELDRAEKHLNELASLEFSYKDVPQLLDRITKIRNKG